MVESPASVRPALTAICAAGRHGRPTGPAGVHVEERATVGMATLNCRAGQRALLGHAVAAAFGIALPSAGKRIVGRDLALTGTGADQWLAEALTPSPGGIEAVLQPLLGPHAGIVDQSHARIVLRLWGPRIRDALATGVPIDLHPRAFAEGDAAQTMVAHIGVLIWQIAADPVYEIAVPRSSFASFWRWFEASAARHGFEIHAKQSETSPAWLEGRPRAEHAEHECPSHESNDK